MRMLLMTAILLMRPNISAPSSAQRAHERILARDGLALDQALQRHGRPAEGAHGARTLQIEAHAAPAQLGVPAVGHRRTVR